MLFTYYAIFREANRQEKQLAMRHGNAMLMHRHSNSGAPSGNNGELSGSGSSKTLTLHEVESDHTPTKEKNLIKFQREHKAARTLGMFNYYCDCLMTLYFSNLLGIIMGTFILCWFPFFSW